mgnify:CR=1 FL=1
MGDHESRVGQKGQVTLPVEMRNHLGIKPKDTVQFVEEGDGIKVRLAASTLRKHFGSVKSHRTPEDWTAMRRDFEELAAEDARTRGQE